MNESEYKEREWIAAEREGGGCVDGDVTGRESLWRECCSGRRRSGKSLCELAVCLLPGLGEKSGVGAAWSFATFAPRRNLARPRPSQQPILTIPDAQHNTANTLPMPHLIPYLSTAHHSFPRLLPCHLPSRVTPGWQAFAPEHHLCVSTTSSVRAHLRWR